MEKQNKAALATQPSRNGFWHRYFTIEAGQNLSWAAVIAGTVTFFAVFALLSLISAAIGFGQFSPSTSDPFSGVGVGMAIWTAISLLISLFAAGFVGGLAARRAGMLHGFLTWALSLVLSVALLSSALAGVTGALGHVLGAAFQVAGSAAGAGAEVVGKGAEALGGQIAEQIQNVDVNQLSSDAQQLLKDTKIPELQPENLSNMLKESRDEALAAGKELVTNPQNHEQILSDLLKSLQSKADKLSQAADREALVNALEQNSQLSHEEAQKAVDNSFAGIEKLSQEASKQLEQAKVQIEKTSKQAEQLVQDVRQGAEDASHKISGVTVAIFFALLIGLALCSYAGYLGSSKTKSTVIEA